MIHVQNRHTATLRSSIKFHNQHSVKSGTILIVGLRHVNVIAKWLVSNIGVARFLIGIVLSLSIFTIKQSEFKTFLLQSISLHCYDVAKMAQYCLHNNRTTYYTVYPDPILDKN